MKNTHLYNVHAKVLGDHLRCLMLWIWGQSLTLFLVCFIRLCCCGCIYDRSFNWFKWTSFCNICNTVSCGIWSFSAIRLFDINLHVRWFWPAATRRDVIRMECDRVLFTIKAEKPCSCVLWMLCLAVASLTPSTIINIHWFVSVRGWQWKSLMLFNSPTRELLTFIEL